MFGKMCMVYVSMGIWWMKDVMLMHALQVFPLPEACWGWCCRERCWQTCPRRGIRDTASDSASICKMYCWFRFCFGCMFRILQVAFGCLGSCFGCMFLAVGTCKMCILCSVLVALEAAGLLHVSVEASCVSQIGLYICQTYTGLKGYIHIGKEYYLYHGHLYIIPSTNTEGMVLSSKCSVAWTLARGDVIGHCR